MARVEDATDCIAATSEIRSTSKSAPAVLTGFNIASLTAALGVLACPSVDVNASLAARSLGYETGLRITDSLRLHDDDLTLPAARPRIGSSKTDHHGEIGLSTGPVAPLATTLPTRARRSSLGAMSGPLGDTSTIGREIRRGGVSGICEKDLANE